MSNAEEAKHRAKAEWDAVAAGWEKHDQRMAERQQETTDKMLRLANLAANSRVLDVGTGTAETAIQAAAMVGAGGMVLGIDLSPGMIEVARKKAAAKGLSNLELREGDAENLDVPEGTFDAVLCKATMPILPSPETFLGHAHRALKPGGRVVVSVFGLPQRNPFLSVPVSVLVRRLGIPLPDRNAPGPFRFANRTALERTIADSGFSDVKVELMVHENSFPDPASLLSMVLDLAAPVRFLLGSVPDDQREDVIAEIHRELEVFRAGEEIVITEQQWIASGTR